MLLKGRLQIRKGWLETLSILGCDNLTAEFADSIFQASEHSAHPMFVDAGRTVRPHAYRASESDLQGSSWLWLDADFEHDELFWQRSFNRTVTNAGQIVRNLEDRPFGLVHPPGGPVSSSECQAGN